MGVLTTGVFVAIGIVLPYIMLFYLVFGFLEDLGYLPRVAIILDRLLHKIGLHGYSVIPMLLTCGCNVPGVLGILLINLLHVSGVIAWIGKLVSPLITGVFGLPKETVAALIIGTVRKDAAVALLEPIGLNSIQMVTAVVVLTLYFPCVATFTVLLKELGMKDTARAVVIMFVATLAAGGGLNLLSHIYSPFFIIFVELALIAIFSFVIPTVFKSKNSEETNKFNY